MPSLFYTEFFRKEVPLTSLLVEYVSERMKLVSPTAQDEEFAQVLSDGLQACGLVDGVPTQEQVIAIARRLGELAEEAASRGEGGSESQAGKNFAGYFMEWRSKLDPCGLCLFLADHNPDLARAYFCELDQSVLVAIARDKLTLEFERARLGFEASLFSFGGKYKGSPSTNEADKEFDLTKDSAAAEVALKNFGF
jgi:hypothetical protein